LVTVVFWVDSSLSFWPVMNCPAVDGMPRHGLISLSIACLPPLSRQPGRGVQHCAASHYSVVQWLCAWGGGLGRKLGFHFMQIGALEYWGSASLVVLRSGPGTEQPEKAWPGGRRAAQFRSDSWKFSKEPETRGPRLHPIVNYPWPRVRAFMLLSVPVWYTTFSEALPSLFGKIEKNLMHHIVPR
jgi:hypothetical protein